MLDKILNTGLVIKSVCVWGGGCDVAINVI